MSANLIELEQLTAMLPPFPDAILDYPGFKEHEMECGHSYSLCLMERPEISVASWYNSAGALFPEHTHDQTEWLIPYIGSLFLTIDDNEKRYMPGMSICIPPKTIHSARFLEDTMYLAICIPSNPDWPKPR